MKNITAHTGKLQIIKKLRNTLNGNPRYLVKVDGWSCKTKPNAMEAYAISNYDGKTVKAYIGTLRGTATVFDIQPA